MGINFKLSGNVKFEMEFVPFVKPDIAFEKPYEVRLLFCSEVFIPLAGEFTFGFRLAFESGLGQLGFELHYSREFTIGNHAVFFVNIVAPW